MQDTLEIFDERVDEIEFYYTVMQELDNNSEKVNTSDNRHFYKIMKSNFVLMLYNLVEACIVSGMMEIYENLKNEGCSYNEVIYEIQEIWSKHKINEIYGPTTEKITYQKRVQEIIKSITSSSPITLSRDALGISGNLNARKIKDICDKHKIRYRLRNDGEELEKIKRDRNSLAHGDKSFSDCERDLTLQDMENLKNNVIQFIRDILDGMKTYYDEKLYKEQST